MKTKDDARRRNDEAFLGLRRLSGGRWRLPVSLAICSGTGRIFGGAGSAALAAALEITSGAQLKVMHVQFLRSSREGDELTGAVSSVDIGRTAHARLTFSGDGGPVIRGTALLGEAEEEPRVERPVPSVPAPVDCAPREYMFHLPGSLNDHLDVRLIAHPSGELPRAQLWVKVPWRLGDSASSIAMAADHVPFALAHAPGSSFAGPVATVDSTIRVIRPAATEWLLVDVSVYSVGDRFAVGGVDLWSEDLELVAIGSQTVSRVRAWTPSD